MAKVLETIFRITGEVSGSLLSAIATAQGALRGLNATSKGFNGGFGASKNTLTQQLTALQKMQATLTGYQAAQGKWQESYKRLTETQRQSTQASREHSEATAETLRLRERVKELDRARQSATSREDKQRLTEQYKAAQETLRAQLKLQNQLTTRTSSAQRSEQSALRTYSAQMRELQRMSDAMRAAGVSTSNFASRQAALAAQIASVSNRIQTLNAHQMRLTNAYEAHNTAGTNFNTAWDNLSNAVTTAQSVLSPVAISAQTAMTFEEAVSKTRALTQMDRLNQASEKYDPLEAERRVGMLESRYMEIGRTTKFSATEAANAGNFMAMAGMSDEVINVGLKPIVQLATATGSSFESAADIITNVMTAFGERWDAPNVGEKIQEYADKLTYGTTHANMTLQMVGEALKYAAPTARMFGSGISETLAMAKFAHDAGVQASMAGTSMRSMFLRLSAPPKAARQAMEENGISVSDSMKEWLGAQELMEQEGFEWTAEFDEKMKRGFFDFAKQWDAVMKDKSSREQMSVASAMFGKHAASGAINILNASSQGLKEFTDALDNSAGSAEKTATVMMDNAQGSLISFRSALEAVQISLGRAFLPAIKGTLDGLTGSLRGLATFVSEHEGLARAFGTLVTAIGATIMGLAAFRLALAGLNFMRTTLELMQATSAMRAVSAVPGVTELTTAGSTVGALGAAGGSTVGALGAAGAASSTAAGGAARAGVLARMSARLAPYMNVGGWALIGATIKNSIGGAFTALSSSVSGLFSSISARTVAFGATLSSFNLTATVSSAFSTLMSLTTRAFGFIRAGLAVLFSPLTVGLTAATVALGAVVTTVQNRWTELQTFFGAIGDQLSNTFTTAFETLSPAFESISTAWTNMMTAFEGNATIQALIDAIGVGLVSSVMAAVQIITGLVTAVTPVFTAIIEAVINFGTELLNLFTAIFQGDIPAILSAIPGIFGSVFEGARAVASAALNGILSLVETIASAISSISFSGLSSAVSNAQAAAYSSSTMGGLQAIQGHATGGIFPKGAHLTWFAEDSAEAAIPLDGSKRSETLWTKVGRLMGILPAVKETPKPVSIASGSRVKLPWWLPEKWKPKAKKPAPTAAPLPAGVPMPLGYPAPPAIEPMNEKIKPPQPSIGRRPTPTFPLGRMPIPMPFPMTRFPKTTPPFVGRTPRKADEKTLEESLQENERLSREETTLERETSSGGMTAAGDLPITVNITFNGAVDREETKAGVMEGLEAMLERLRHEQARRAYA